MQINNNLTSAGGSSALSGGDEEDNNANSRDTSSLILTRAISESDAVPVTGLVNPGFTLSEEDELACTDPSNDQPRLINTQESHSITSRTPSFMSQYSSASYFSAGTESSANSERNLIPDHSTSRSNRGTARSNRVEQAPASCAQRVTGALRRYTNPAIQLQAKYTSRYSVGLNPQSSANETNGTSNESSRAAWSQQSTTSSTCPPCQTTCPSFPPIYPAINASTTTSAPSTNSTLNTTNSNNSTILSTASTSTTLNATSMETSSAPNTTASDQPSTDSLVGLSEGSIQATVWASNGLQLEVEARERELLYGNSQISLHSEAGLNVSRYVNLEVSANTGLSVTREGDTSFFTSTKARFNLGVRGSIETTTSTSNNSTTASTSSTSSSPTSYATGEINAGANIRTEHHWDLENRSPCANRAIGAVLGLSHMAGAAAGFVLGSNFAAPSYGTSIGGAAGSMLATHALNMFPGTRSDRVVRSIEPEATVGGAINILVAGGDPNAPLESRDSVDLVMRLQPRIRFENQVEEVPLVEEQEEVRPIPFVSRRPGSEGAIVRRRRTSNVHFGNANNDIEMTDMTNNSNNSSTEV